MSIDEQSFEQQMRESMERVATIAALQARWQAWSNAFDWAYGFACAFALAWWFDTAAHRTAVRFLVAVVLLALIRTVSVRLLAIPLVDKPMKRFAERWRTKPS